MSKRPSQVAHAFAEKVITDNEYQDNLLQRARAGILSPVVEKTLWEYYAGRPQENLNITFDNSLRQKDDTELFEMFSELQSDLKRLEELRATVSVH